MSLILDALKRAEQERQQGSSTPGLHTPSPTVTAEVLTGKRAWGWMGLGFAALALAVGLSVTLATRLSVNTLSHSDPATNREASHRALAQTSATEPSVSVPTPKPTSVQPGTLNLHQHVDVSALYRATDDTTTATLATVQHLYTPEPAPKTRAASEPRPAPTPSPRAQQILAARIPPIHELPRALQQAIPSIHYHDHLFQEQGPANRVVLNGRELHVGAQLDQDLRVDDILHDHVVMSFKGQRFTLRAYNSWINM